MVCDWQCMCAVSFSCCDSFQIIAQLAALSLKLCHQKEYVCHLTYGFKEKGGNEIKGWQGYEARKEGEGWLEGC